MDDLLRDLAEPTLTLEEALELIDTCDVVSSLSTPDLPACNDPEAASQAAVAASSEDPTKPKKRVRNPLNDVWRRQRRKAERQQLKDQVEEYEAQLERLKRCGQAQPDAGALTPQRTWLHAVIQEQRKRRQAEQINAKLRQLLAERRQTAWAVRDALAKEKRLLSKLESSEEVMASMTSSALKSSLSADDSRLSGLRLAVQRVFDSTDAVFGSFRASGFDSVESISRVKQRDQSGGQSIELLTATPLACGFQTAKRVLWGVLADKKWPGDQKAFDLKAKESSNESMELKYSMGLEPSELSLNGATLLQRKDEDDRTVLAWTSMITHTHQQLRFQSEGWIVIMKSPTSPHAASSLRTCCRISASSDGIHSSSSVKLQNSILRSMGHRVKSRVEGVQQSLVERIGLPGSAGLIFI
ncbi:hypothetical protein PHYSODRAFT_362259 [Phytophthora sojae]|uniref:Uncharacterized protein n=1 Tax=Phytophthora sojae (strain P6497) TaxID=1094619 RepID=G5AAL2_PHYSP|nr:hypothetical protein PHYSODRAFT_362259 [Phytophthora sojae]EGZ07641.1 hypothetical protein PHYSODRAFT_362259 [Phytophthora sojae]|eukprot:XP_009537207.1 hypothetical protein PHYSODRAFT_362259 [Phytophthora sojae]